MLNIILMGPPGAGKGTHAKWISRKFNIPHISTGDMFREAISSGTPLGNQVKAVIERGDLVNDELTCSLVKERLSRKDCEHGYLLDGFPRTLAQAEALKVIGREIGREPSLALNLSCPNDVLLRRIGGRRVCPKCGASYNIHTMKPKQDGICDLCGTALIQRKDDNEESFKVRLANYDKSTAPLLEYYEKEHLLHTFDGNSDATNLEVMITSFLEGMNK